MKIHYVTLLVLVLSCCRQETTESDYTVFTNVTLIDGSGDAPITNAVVVVSGGRITAAGPMASITYPADANTIDLTGKFVVPGFINSHGHVGDVKGIEGGHYSRENIIENLSIYARYGITTVVSLGGDKEEAEALRDVNDSVPGQRARLYIAGEVISGKTPGEATAVVDKNRSMGVDWMKIRVDDNLGTSPKMTEDVYTAVIKRSHDLGYKIATHMYYLEDAKKLLTAGSDLMAHSVRDQMVDDEFIGLMRKRNVCYCPTLTRELSTYVYESTPEFFYDPFFTQVYDTTITAPLRDPARQDQVYKSKSAQTYKTHLPVAEANLIAMVANDVRIAFGTDSGIPTRFFGYFEHVEMAMMAKAGMTPMQIIVSATKNAAECMGLKDLGMIKPGYKADFIVLTKDPLTNIRNSRTIESVWIAGEDVKRR
jgi:imidazolonepropionase-like amidohydrolase